MFPNQTILALAFILALYVERNSKACLQRKVGHRWPIGLCFVLSLNAVYKEGIGF